MQQSFTIPVWIWINFAVLVAAAVYIGVKLAASRQQRAPGGLRRVIK